MLPSAFRGDWEETEDEEEEGDGGDDDDDAAEAGFSSPCGAG